MAYKYSFDRRAIGDVWFRRGSYEFYQKGLIRLRDLVREWNEREPEPPYPDEVRDLTNMIEWAAPRLAKVTGPDDDLYVNGIGLGSLRYLKAAAVLQVLEAEEGLERDLPRIPDGVIQARRRAIAEMKRLANVGVLDEADPADVLWEVAPAAPKREPPARAEGVAYEWDVFVCHATEDKEAFVDGLVRALKAADVKVWYDTMELRVGDSLRRSIEKGLSRSHYGIVVLSPRFFEKDWPQRELNGMAALEVGGRKVILPIWHQLGVEDVRRRSPMLADRVAVSSERGIEAAVDEILKVLDTPRDIP